MVEVVAALIWDKDKFLICQRPKNKARALLWEFVGGKVEQGETKEQALIRECKEELNIAISVRDVFMEVVHEYPDITVHLTLFNATIAEGVPQKLEHNDIKWITPEEIPDYDFCQADEEILKKLRKEKTMSDNDKIRKTREENHAKQAENEKKNPFVLAGFGLACIISAYYLAYDQDFFGYTWIAKTIIVVFLIIATLVCFIPTVNYYFKGKIEWLFISLGVLLIPCNYMWFLLWPNMITKVSAAVAFFLSIMFSTTGFFRLLYKEIQEIKAEKEENYTKAVLTIVGEILAITLSIAQIIITFR